MEGMGGGGEGGGMRGMEGGGRGMRGMEGGAGKMGGEIGAQNGGGQLGAQLGAQDAQNFRKQGDSSQSAAQLGGAKGQYDAAVNNLEQAGVKLDKNGNIDTSDLSNQLDPTKAAAIKDFNAAKANYINTNTTENELNGEGAAQAAKDAKSAENQEWKAQTTTS
jgi:hypothetical protein